MFKLINQRGAELAGFLTLESAMQAAKATGLFVTIVGPENFEVCGMFGVDSIKNGMTPDGNIYDWNKNSRIGATKRIRA